ncbi:hypothetical protein ACXIU6_22135 [Vibrio parahaemolyticus]|nr:hypothetical protein [Vibrio parahaemolyticus]
MTTHFLVLDISVNTLVLVLGSWFLVLGSWFLVLGSWLLVSKLKKLVLSSITPWLVPFAKSCM